MEYYNYNIYIQITKCMINKYLEGRKTITIKEDCYNKLTELKFNLTMKKKTKFSYEDLFNIILEEYNKNN